jgi:ABC-type sugar transport system ATPase subunit
VAQAIFGLDPEATGRVAVGGSLLAPGSIDAALAAGLGLVPEDRKRQGLVLGLNCRENTVLAALRGLSRFGWVQRVAERTLAQRYVSRLRVVSSELPELIGLCRRILIMRNGQLAGEVARADFSEATLMRLIAGVAAA